MLSHVERVALIEAPHLKLERLRCDLIDIDGSVIDEFGDEVSALTVNYERTGRVNRMVSMTTTRELHWGRHRVAPYITISSSSGLMDEDIPLGVFATTRAPRNRESDPREFAVTGYDLLYLVDWPLIEAFTARAGTTTVLEYAEQLISSRGIISVALDPSRAGSLLNEARTWAFTEQLSTLDVINDLLATVGYDTLAMSTTGVAVAGPILNCGQRPSLWTYNADADTSSVVVGVGDYDDDCTSTPNHWTFYIDSVDRATPIVEGDGIYTVQNDSEGPCSIVERGGVFPAEPVRVEANTHSDLVAQGDKIVAEEMHAQQRLTLEADLNPYHQHRDVVEVIDSRQGVDGRFLVDTWEMDVFDMSMRMTLAKTVHHDIVHPAVVEEGPPSEAEGDELFWEPPGFATNYAGFTTINITSATTFIDCGSNPTVINFQVPLLERASIVANNHVVIIGFESFVNLTLSGPGDTRRAALTIRDDGAPVAGAVAHLEGAKIHGYYSQGDVFIDAPSHIVQLQNCRWEQGQWARGRSGSQHPDCFQAYGGAKEIRVDKCTGYLTYQGTIVGKDPGQPADALTGAVTIRRTNFETQTTAANIELNDPTVGAPDPVDAVPNWILHATRLFDTANNEGPLTLDRVTFRSVRPELNDGANTAGRAVPLDGWAINVATDADGKYVEYTSTPRWTAGSKLYEREPFTEDGSDWVAAADVGLRAAYGGPYVSPGYQ